MPGWLSMIIGIVVDLILTRILPRTEMSAQRMNEGGKQVARLVVQRFPEINYECLLSVIPKFIDDLVNLAKEGKLRDPMSLVMVGLNHLGSLIRCQFGGQAYSDAQIKDKIVSCGIAAIISYIRTRDFEVVISGFVSCLFGSSPPPDDDDDDDDTTSPPPGDDGNIKPQEPVLRDYPRCGGSGQVECPPSDFSFFLSSISGSENPLS